MAAPAVAQSFALSADGKILACGSEEMIRLWDLPSGKLHRTLPTKGTVESVSLAPGAKVLACATDLERAELWDVPAGELKQRWLAYSPVVLSPDGKMLACDRSDTAVRLCDVEKPAERRWLLDLEGHSEVVRSITFSADVATLATASSRLFRE
jgi:WD40 repeat protein